MFPLDGTAKFNSARSNALPCRCPLFCPPGTRAVRSATCGVSGSVGGQFTFNVAGGRFYLCNQSLRISYTFSRSVFTLTRPNATFHTVCVRLNSFTIRPRLAPKYEAKQRQANGCYASKVALGNVFLHVLLKNIKDGTVLCSVLPYKSGKCLFALIFVPFYHSMTGRKLDFLVLLMSC